MEKPKNLDEFVQAVTFAHGCCQINQLNVNITEAERLITLFCTLEFCHIPTEKLAELIVHDDSWIRTATKQVLDSRLSFSLWGLEAKDV